MKWLYLILLLVAGCVEIKYRPPPEAGAPCEVDAECAAAAPVCDAAGSGTCVQCLPSVAESCGGLTPVCGADYACRACVAHSDCASNACLPDGSCAAEADVIYLQQAGAGNACTRSAPCGGFQNAVGGVTSKRRYLRISGMLTGSNDNDEDLGKSFTLLGEPGAVLRSTSARPLLDMRRGETIEIYDLLLDPLEVGVNIEGGSRLVLHRSKISGGRSEAILIRGGSATVSQSEISESGGNNARRAISLQNGELTIERSKISSNPGGGIVVSTNQRFFITNSFIVSNAGSGGLTISRPGPGSRLELNTIVDNRTSGTGFTDVGGIFCDDGAFSFSGNLIFRNRGGILGGTVQTLGDCKYGNSFVAAGDDADDPSLGFRSNEAPFDFHLTAGSPTSVRDAAGVCTGVDYDGDSRAGGLCDLGADEHFSSEK